MLSLHTLAIIIHAASATGAFISGVILLFQSNKHRQLQFAVALLVLLILMEAFLVIAILSHLTSLPAITEIIFGALAILGLYMIWRAVQALFKLQAEHVNQLAVIDDVGFVLISLFDGFAIVSSIDLGAPGWLVAAIAVGAVVIGIYAINARKKAIATQSM